MAFRHSEIPILSSRGFQNKRIFKFSGFEISSRFSKLFFNNSTIECCSGFLKSNCFHTWHCVSTCRNMFICNAWHLQPNKSSAANFERAPLLYAQHSMCYASCMNLAQRIIPCVMQVHVAQRSIPCVTQVYMHLAQRSIPRVTQVYMHVAHSSIPSAVYMHEARRSIPCVTQVNIKVGQQSIPCAVTHVHMNVAQHSIPCVTQVYMNLTKRSIPCATQDMKVAQCCIPCTVAQVYLRIYI